MRRLGRNRDGYRGDLLDVTRTLEACDAAAKAWGWQRELLPPDRLARPTYHRPAKREGLPKLYISSGIHGDEPAGPLAAQQLLEEDQWPEAEIWLVPCLNPMGFQIGSRFNPEGWDINRDYRHLRTEEARGHVEWLQKLPPLDLTLLLHEDWESHGFYTYELNRKQHPSVARAMIDAVREVCPIDESAWIDGRPVSETGIIRPDITPEERPEWPEAVWLRVHKCELSYTMEAPSDWPLQTRTRALVTAVRSAMQTFSSFQ